MIKDDHRDTRNPYKFMNVMKQDVTDDKIIERCKNVKNKSLNKKKCYAHRFKTHTHTHTKQV